MRENRLSGSEGGGVNPIAAPYPYFIDVWTEDSASSRRSEMFLTMRDASDNMFAPRSFDISLGKPVHKHRVPTGPKQEI